MLRLGLKDRERWKEGKSYAGSASHFMPESSGSLAFALFAALSPPMFHVWIHSIIRSAFFLVRIRALVDCIQDILLFTMRSFDCCLVWLLSAVFSSAVPLTDNVASGDSTNDLMGKKSVIAATPRLGSDVLGAPDNTIDSNNEKAIEVSSCSLASRKRDNPVLGQFR